MRTERESSSTEQIETVRSLPPVVRTYWILIVALTVGALAISYFAQIPLLLPPAHHFMDLMCYEARFMNYGTAFFYAPDQGPVPWELPAPMAILYHFYFLQPAPVAAFLATVAVTLLAATAILIILLRQKGIAWWQAALFGVSALLTAYPLWMMIECANFEFFVVLFVGAGLGFYLRKRDGWAAACFGVAAALKITPVIYFALLFKRKSWRQLAIGVLVGVVCFLGSHFIVGPTFSMAMQGTRDALDAYKYHLVLGYRPSEIGYNHSFLSFWKQVFLLMHGHWGLSTVPFVRVYTWYMALMAVLGTVLYFGWIRRLPRLNQAFAIVTCALLLTPVSWDYRLTHLYVTWVFLLLYAIERPEQRGLRVMFVALALLFTAQTFLHFFWTWNGTWYEIGFGGQVKTVLLFVLLWAAMKWPLEQSAGLETRAG
jgi:hypothetical protein